MARFERAKGSRSARKPTWLILVEGKQREKNYVTEAKLSSPLARSHALAVEPLNGGGVPGNIAQACDEIESRGADKVYLVLDADLLPPHATGKNAEAINEQLAKVGAINADPKKGDIVLIRSKPCVEAWFVLHFQATVPNHPDCGPLKTLVKTLCPNLDKRPKEDWRKLDALREAAKERAKAIRARGGEDAALTLCGSEMDLLLDDLEL